MIWRLLVNWLLKGMQVEVEDKVKADVRDAVRSAFRLSLLKAFDDMEKDSARVSFHEWYCFIEDDMEHPVRSLHSTVEKVVQSKASEWIGRLGEMRQSIPEAIASEVLKEHVIDAIIAKINSKQLKGGLPT